MKRYLTVLQAIVPLALLVVALWVLHRNLKTVSWREILTYFRTLPLGNVGIAIGITIAAYLVLTLYDFAGTRYAGSKISWRKVAPASFIAYAFSNSIGHPLVTGTPIRVRFYSAEGIDGIGIAKIVSYAVGGFWLGFAALGGVTLCIAPASMLELRVLLEGVFEHRRFLDLVRHFIVFEDSDTGAIAKKIAGYHQFHAVRKALAAETVRSTHAPFGLSPNPVPPADCSQP